MEDFLRLDFQFLMVTPHGRARINSLTQLLMQTIDHRATKPYQDIRNHLAVCKRPKIETHWKK